MHDRSSQVRLTDHRVLLQFCYWLVVLGLFLHPKYKVYTLFMVPWGLNDCFRPPCTLHCTILLLCVMHIFSVIHVCYKWAFILFYSRIILAICNNMLCHFIVLLLLNTVKCFVLYTFSMWLALDFMHFWLKILQYAYT